METILIAALVAGFVSLLGVIANLYIARQTRRATIVQSKLQAVASMVSESDTALKDFIAEAERLRICCWEVLGRLDSLKHSDGDDVFKPLIDSNGILRDAIYTFSEGTRVFAKSWAPVKGDIPRGIEIYLRSTRHHCLNESRLVVELMERLLMAHEQKNETNVATKEQDYLKKKWDYLKRSEESLHRLLDALDRLISLMRTVRESGMEERTKKLKA
jgi:hypothetical protein